MADIRIVETVTATSMAALLRGRNASRDADLVELRLDGVRDLDVARALEGRRCPVIVTVRPTWEGGAFDGSEEERQALMAQAVAAGAEYVDIERRASWRPDLTGSQTRLVLSEHDFSGVPTDLLQRMVAMQAEGPAVVKAAVMPTCAGDCAALGRLQETLAPTAGDTDMVIIGMGAFGRVTRAFPAAFGSCWTYGGSIVSGQFSIAELAHQFRVRSTTAQTRLYAVTGQPLGHSASPAMHNAAFQSLGLDAVYVPLEATSAADAQRLADALGVQGLSVTAPFKSLDVGWQVSPDDSASTALGVTNTLKRVPAGWLGRNVDGDGFLDGCDARGLQLSGQRVVIVGAGGAARSVAHALAGRQALVSISARRTDEAVQLAEAVGGAVTAFPPEGPWDMLVNATPLGTWPNEEDMPVPREAIATGSLRAGVVYDLVYHPEQTTLLRTAAREGAQVISGLDMLVGQAIRQSSWWTGQTPSAEVMTTAARAWMTTRRASEDGQDAS